eukprot:TRINITY_DN3357_c3_g1_i1.p1 TRINITY_DN3357_c3_g1~~TRINITY_DN3357_c3_g1_i1.p1  ORF type:complete len:319 (+),score=54.22 TRINITY_DN3357_c3_g1_i1:79-1035(+)
MSVCPDGSPEPFWGCVTSTVDWCESNYVVVSFVAEFANTLSSLLITVTALIGWYLSRRDHVVATQLAYSVAFACVAFVGIGSAAFHATLRTGPQYLDEVPMLIAATCYIYILLKNEVNTAYNHYLALCLMTTLVVAVFYYVVMDVFLVFFLCYFFSCTFLVLYPIISTRLFRDQKYAVPKKMCLLSSAMYLTGFGMWLWEHFRCLETVTVEGKDRMQASPSRGAETEILPLHSCWHIAAGMGSTLYVGFLITLKSLELNIGSKVERSLLCCMHAASSDEAIIRLPSDDEPDEELIVVDMNDIQPSGSESSLGDTAVVT